MKHITIINQYIGSPSHGMEYRHYYLAKNLMQLGYRVTLISGSYSHLFSRLPDIKGDFTKESIDGIEYIWVKVPHYHSSKSLGRIWNMFYFSWKLRFLKKLAPSHIIVSSPSLFPVKIGKKLARKFGGKFLFEIRDIWPLTLVELSGLKESHPLIRIMAHYERYGYQNADKVVSLLPNAKEHFIANGMDEKKFVYLPNGIEFSDTHVTLPKDIADQIPKDKFIIAYTGTIGIANNLDYLLDAAQSLLSYEDIAFVILGNGGEKERLQERVLTQKLKNVIFIDAIDKVYMQSFLEKVDVAFISLLPEKLFRFGVSPNKIFEYMYAKKPVIWAVEAGNDPVKEAGCGMSVGLGKVNQLKETILKLKSLSKNELRKLGNNGYNYVLQYHSYKMLAEKLKKVIEDDVDV